MGFIAYVDAPFPVLLFFGCMVWFSVIFDQAGFDLATTMLRKNVTIVMFSPLQFMIRSMCRELKYLFGITMTYFRRVN